MDGPPVFGHAGLASITYRSALRSVAVRSPPCRSPATPFKACKYRSLLPIPLPPAYKVPWDAGNIPLSPVPRPRPPSPPPARPSPHPSELPGDAHEQRKTNTQVLFKMYGVGNGGGFSVGREGLQAFILDIIAASPSPLAPIPLPFPLDHGDNFGGEKLRRSPLVPLPQRGSHGRGGGGGEGGVVGVPDFEVELKSVLVKMADVVLAEVGIIASVFGRVHVFFRVRICSLAMPPFRAGDRGMNKPAHLRVLFFSSVCVCVFFFSHTVMVLGCCNSYFFLLFSLLIVLHRH